MHRKDRRASCTGLDRRGRQAVVVRQEVFVAQQQPEPARAGEKYYFLIRRLHSLSGLVPVGVFLVVHLLAPLYGLSLIGASRKETARAWAGTLAIVLAVLVVRSFPEPWRGITDFAVAAALAWGLAAIVRGVPSALR